MIRVHLGSEPSSLPNVRNVELTRIKALKREPYSKEISGYRVVAKELWEIQHFKCCFCEFKIKLGHQDVEHYRPKAFANRSPGSGATHGYWWLAYTWGNLFYSCSNCNQTYKRSHFPLDNGSIALIKDENPPGGELPLLLNPGGNINPVSHIIFVFDNSVHGKVGKWWARPRNGSILGNQTISIAGLNDESLIVLRQDYYENNLKEKIDGLNEAINSNDKKTINFAFRRALAMLSPTMQFVAFSYDVFVSSFSQHDLYGLIGQTWPHPSAVGLRQV